MIEVIKNSVDAVLLWKNENRGAKKVMQLGVYLQKK